MDDADERYVVAGSRPWCREVFNDRIRGLPGNWTFISGRDELMPDLLVTIDPRYLFFLHWSWLVPNSITERYECINFHMADLPFGRGGSPLQNQVQRGITHTRLAASRMTSDLDAGPVYARADFCLQGNAEAVYLRANELAADLIGRITAEHPTPLEQEGEPVDFVRRSPAESEISDLGSLERLASFIAMLDADGYPHAYIDHGGYRFSFSRPARYTGRVVADVTISRHLPSGAL
jgi:methionyl-tRNA formyltransferase